MIFYHNPRCQKSRQALELINEKHNIDNVKVIEYLKNPPTKKELKEIVSKLGIKAEELVRKNEPVYKEQFKGKKLNNEEWIEAMITHPKLIERPILISDNKGVIGRPPENILSLL